MSQLPSTSLITYPQHSSLTASSIYHEADGIIIPTIEAYDPPESIAYLRDFFALTSRKLFVVGPLMSAVSGTNAVKQQTSSSAKFQEIEAFMARILESRGPRSLVYVRTLYRSLAEHNTDCVPQMAFGSAFWSDEPEKTWAFVDTMLEKKIPFVCQWISLSTPPGVLTHRIDHVPFFAIRASAPRDASQSRRVRAGHSHTLGAPTIHSEQRGKSLSPLF